jgi:hypothetical protein
MAGVAYSNGGSWINGSSREYKENIESLETGEALITLANLDPVKFNYKANATEKHLGFIAEDVPELVAKKDRKGLSPMDIVAVLTKVVQEQQESLKSKTELPRFVMSMVKQASQALETVVPEGDALSKMKPKESPVNADGSMASAFFPTKK